jgi:hypothetical protein
MIITDHVSKISLFTNHGRVAITNHVRNFSTFTVTLSKKRPITDHGKRSYLPPLFIDYECVMSMIMAGTFDIHYQASLVFTHAGFSSPALLQILIMFFVL